MFQSVWQASQILWTLYQQQVMSAGRERQAHYCCSYQTEMNGEIVEFDHYEPLGSYLGTMVVIHGMSPKGKADPRISSLCQALSKVGYRVLAPDIESIKQLQICPSQINYIAQILELVVNDKTMTPSGNIGVLAPSFSGAMCLAAASFPTISDRIKAICAIGSFTEVDSVMSYLLSSRTADPYGRFIVLKKIVPLVCPENTLFLGALDAAIQDNLNEICFDEFTNAYHQYLSRVPESERQKIRRLFHDSDYRQQLFLSSKCALAQELKELDIINRVDNLSAKVFLLHGAMDSVIPCQQSERLYSQLKQLKKSAELVITPFISHGDTRFRMAQLPDVAKILYGFSLYFKSVSGITR